MEKSKEVAGRQQTHINLVPAAGGRQPRWPGGYRENGSQNLVYQKYTLIRANNPPLSDWTQLHHTPVQDPRLEKKHCEQINTAMTKTLNGAVHGAHILSMYVTLKSNKILIVL